MLLFVTRFFSISGTKQSVSVKCRSKSTVSSVVNLIITTRKRSLGKVIFSVACVKNSVHRGFASVHARIPPPWQADPPRQGRPPWQGRPPPGQGRPPPQGRPPLHSACWEIRSTSGRYASYWNAILLCYVNQWRI